MQESINDTRTAIHRIELMLKDIQHDVSINTVDLAEHIKRTELLEKKLSKIYIAALVGAGFMAAQFGPEVLKIIGILA